MDHRITAAVLLGAAAAIAACSSGATAARTPSRAAAPSRPAAPAVRTARYAFAQRDTPYKEVLASARSSGRPAILFFWASW